MYVAGWKSRESVPKLVNDYLAGKIMIDEFITHTMPLENINQAFDLMHAGKRCAQFSLCKEYFLFQSKQL